MSERTDVAIIGAGVVGLACAAALARAGREVVILERHGRVGTETSSRNSEVIHAGLYYPPDSLKAQTCVEGRRALYERCARLGIAHRKLGKLVVATDAAQIATLERLQDQGRRSGAGALRLLDGAEVRGLEPRVRAVAGLWSPESGIVDGHGLIDSYRREAQDHGALLALATNVQRVEPIREGWRLHTQSASGESTALEVRWLVNAAGLNADRVATWTGADVQGRDWRLYPCKGDYFSLAPRLRGLARHLVYPVPDGAGLGVHITQDLGGALRAGPDTCYVERPHYDVDPQKRAAFGAALRRYLPEVRDEDLEPGYAGVRPKLAGPGQGFRDFVCEVVPEAPRVVQLIGIESPGLTAASALARRVVAHIQTA